MWSIVHNPKNIWLWELKDSSWIMADPALISPPTLSFTKQFHTVVSPLVFQFLQSVSSYFTSILSLNFPIHCGFCVLACIFPIYILASWSSVPLSLYMHLTTSLSCIEPLELMFCRHTETCMTCSLQCCNEYFLFMHICLFQFVYVSIPCLFAIGEDHGWVCVSVNANESICIPCQPVIILIQY